MYPCEFDNPLTFASLMWFWIKCLNGYRRDWHETWHTHSFSPINCKYLGDPLQNWNSTHCVEQRFKGESLRNREKCVALWVNLPDFLKLYASLPYCSLSCWHLSLSHGNMCDDGALCDLPAITHCLAGGNKSIIYFCLSPTAEKDTPSLDS